jgi:hypothetical protein
LDELTAVAESDAIDNTDVFDPAALARLLSAVMGDAGDIKPRWRYEEGGQHIQEYTFQHDLYNAMHTVMERYREPLRRTDEPPHWNEEHGIMYERDDTAYPEDG